MTVRTKRVYEQPAADDGRRILVDRLWPRGLTKDRAAIDGWLREAGPSTELRRWFGHDPARWSEFKRRYFHELDRPEGREALVRLRDAAREGVLTLVYAAKDEEHNNAEALRERLATRTPAARAAGRRR